MWPRQVIWSHWAQGFIYKNSGNSSFTALFQRLNLENTCDTEWSQVRRRRTNIVWYHLYVNLKLKGTNELIYKTEIQSQMLKTILGEGVINWETWTDIYIRLRNMCLSVQMFSCVQLLVTAWTVAHQAPLSVGFYRQEYWSGYHSLLQGIFWPRSWTWGSCVSCTGKWILYH